MSQQSILVVDDDPHIRDVVRFALEREGWAVFEAGNGKLGLETALSLRPDAIILDILMPEMDGLEVCRELRKTSDIPIVFLSSKDDEIDRILGLEMGGDDYVSKPFSPRELVARLKIIFRRRHPLVAPVESRVAVLSCGQLKLDPQNYQAWWQEQLVVLTATEFNLLQTFLTSPQRVFTRDALIQADVFKDIISDRTIDSHIRRLRQKFAASGCQTVIETAHGFGYKLGTCD